MGSDEPALLDVCEVPRRSREGARVLGLADRPQSWGEILAVLVDRQGMVAVLDHGPQTRMQKAERLPADALNAEERDSERADRIPDSDNLDVDGQGVLQEPNLLDGGVLQFTQITEPLQLPDRPGILALVALVKLPDP